MLTDLGTVKAWLTISSDTDDTVLTTLIGQVSQMILAYLQRPSIFRHQYTEQFAGTGSRQKMLRNFPVIDISSLTVGTAGIPGGDGLKSGYWVAPEDDGPPGRPQVINLIGYCFERGCTGKVIYTAGYCVVDEPHAAGAQVQVLAPYGQWACDHGVSYSTGDALTKVAGTPSIGQYALGARGQYVFASADNGRSVEISYSYVPAAVEQACIELVGERYRYRSRIGQTSQSMNGATTTSYSLKDMPDYIKLALQPFRRLVPV
jgi:Phage gp6-like head-tail connector protein